jgi:hypothetical protein
MICRLKQMKEVLGVPKGYTSQGKKTNETEKKRKSSRAKERGKE